MSKAKLKDSKGNNIKLVPSGQKQAAGLLPNIYDYKNVGKYRWNTYQLQGNDKGIDKASREQVVRISRELFATYPIFNVASELKAHWVVGDHWDMKFTGLDSAWGAQAEYFINNVWANRCTTRGFNYDLKTVIKLLSQTLDSDGDMLTIFTKDANNWPLLQFITTDRVTDKVENGGLITLNNVSYSYNDGVLFDANGTPAFFAIKESDTSYKYVSVQNSKLVFNPQFFDKHRGLPALYAGTLYGLSLSELDQYLMETLKLESTIGLMETNDSGEVPAEYTNLMEQIDTSGNSTGVNPNNASAHALEIIQGSSIRYLKSGNDIKSFRSQKPSEEIQSYMNRIETALLSAIGYPHQLIYSPETISGRAVNAITEHVRKSVRARQSLLYKHVKFYVAWALSVAIENGDLPKTNENIFNVIDFVMPEQYSLDKDYERKCDNDDFKLGITTLQALAEKNGNNYTEIRADRLKETDNLLADIDSLSKKHPLMPVEIILNLLSQRGTSTLSIKQSDEPTLDTPPV